MVGVLERLGARYEAGAHKCRSISLTLVTGNSLRRTVERAMREGGWVLVHGCHAGVEVDHVKALTMIKSVDEGQDLVPVSYTPLRAHDTGRNLVCRLLPEKKKKKQASSRSAMHYLHSPTVGHS